MDDPRCIELLRFAGSKGLPVVFHLDVPYLPPNGGRYVGNNVWKGGTVDNLERAMQACPDTIFIGHAYGFLWRCTAMIITRITTSAPWPLWTPITFVDECPNLYADLSAGSARRALAQTLI